MVAGDGRTVDVGVTVSSFRRLEQYTCQSLNRVRNEEGVASKAGNKEKVSVEHRRRPYPLLGT